MAAKAMTAKQVLGRLKAAGSAQTRQIYARHGMTGPMFGVKHSDLGNLRKQIGTNHGVAVKLWDSGNVDARVLATMIADPQQLTLRGLDSWLADCDNYGITNSVAQLTARSPLAKKKMRKWIRSKKEWTGAAGWNVLGRLSDSTAELDDAELFGYLDTIETGIHHAKNRVRHNMNDALIAIGVRNSKLRKRAFAVAKKIGVVEVDHGQTSCKTLDATSRIHKALAHRKAMAERRAAKALSKKT